MSLIHREPVILRIADHVRPAEIPGLVGRRGGEEVVERAQRYEALSARPAAQHRLIVRRDVFARPGRHLHGWRTAAEAAGGRRNQRSEAALQEPAATDRAVRIASERDVRAS